MTEKLNSCPFDGAEAQLQRDSGNEVWPQRWFTMCLACEASSPNYFGSSSWAQNAKEDAEAAAKAVDWWNRRPPAKEPQ